MRLRFKRGRPDTLETLHPGYFALVMATGIVALATHLHGVAGIPDILFWLNACFLPVLLAATLARSILHHRAFMADLRSHSRAVGFFTITPAFGVFGSQLVLQKHLVGLAVFFLAVTGMLWAIIGYGILAALTVSPKKPGLADGLNGGWLVSVVATQSVSVLSVLVLPFPGAGELQQVMMFAALVLWLAGGALYLWLATLIFYRCMFLRMTPEDLTPPYWINMGAVAISTLAGATLLDHAALSPIVAQLSLFVKGLTLFFWAVGSWWIPMLALLGAWRYLICGVPFSYNPLYWGGVFPLGMYSVCTYGLAHVLDAWFLMPLSVAFMVIAVAAWTAAFVGLVDSLLASGGRGAASARPPGSAPSP